MLQVVIGASVFVLLFAQPAGIYCHGIAGIVHVTPVGRTWKGTAQYAGYTDKDEEMLVTFKENSLYKQPGRQVR